MWGSGESIYSNAMYVTTLDAASHLATALGMPADAAKYASAEEPIKQAANTRLWNEAMGAYNQDDTTKGTVTEMGNAWAIFSGIAPEARAQRSLATLFRVLTPWDPPVSGYTAFAAFQGGQTAKALQLIRRLWGTMINQDPGGTDFEHWTGPADSGTVLTSHAHGWSAGATPALTEYVAGITPVTPGYAMWSVSPQVGDLRWAQAVVETPHGQIFTGWQRGTRDSSFKLTESTPAGTSGVVSVPLLGAPRVISEDGHVVWNGSHAVGGGPSATGSADYVRFAVGAGIHTLVWSAGPLAVQSSTVPNTAAEVPPWYATLAWPAVAIAAAWIGRGRRRIRGRAMAEHRSSLRDGQAGT
jgi:hypothetical protein